MRFFNSRAACLPSHGIRTSGEAQSEHIAVFSAGCNSRNHPFQSNIKTAKDKSRFLEAHIPDRPNDICCNRMFTNEFLYILTGRFNNLQGVISG